MWYVFVKASDCVQAVFQQEGSRYAFSMSAGMFLNPSAPLSKACTHSLKVLCTHLTCCRMYIGFEWNVVHEWIKTRQIMEKKFWKERERPSGGWGGQTTQGQPNDVTDPEAALKLQHNYSWTLSFQLLWHVVQKLETGNNDQSSSRFWFCIAHHKFSLSCPVYLFFKNNFKTSLKHYFWWHWFLRNPADEVKKLSEIIFSHSAIFYEESPVAHFY